MIEPTSLISRLMVFVMAGAVTVLIVLIATLSEMFPLERTQIFFLKSEPSANQVISIEKFGMTLANIGEYKNVFIKEYVVKRNQILPDNGTMQTRWRSDKNGVVYAYSSIDVYSKFIDTEMWNAVMVGKYQPLTFNCNVSFGKIIPRQRTSDFEKYAVNFRYICYDESARQSISKDFTIALSLAFQTNINWDERLENPLGLKVVGYEIESGDTDPLNPTKWLKMRN
jgi:type IV secretory pathway component VirB8